MLPSPSQQVWEIIPRKKIEETKALAFEDGPFTKKIGTKKRRAPLIAVLTKGFMVLKIAFDYLKVDGSEATDLMIDLEKHLSSDEDINIIFLHGVAYAGFNVVDVQRLREATNRPIILVLRSKPNPEAVKEALIKHFRDWDRRLDIISKAGDPRFFEVYPGIPIFYETIGMEAHEAEALIRAFTILGKTPEPLRIARILAEALGTF
ncbi:DUF99 family protein [Candidatus Bathyarchaeota archaeon]|nr:DUF99 family protein [Candidatus Bathyarchaeota archaeon]MBS7627520.1 DUF99 family protein [Candidatus Bathyarchaeota archaeon]